MRRWILYVLLAGLAAVALPASAGAQQSQPRIIGGGEAAITDYPYQVRVTIQSTLILEGQCGGSFRDASHIVTAAHCVTDDVGLRTETAPGNVTVHYGSNDATTQSTATVSDVSVAPRYLARDDNYDAALLTLTQPIPSFPFAGANRIPFASAGELATAVAAGAQATATGYGVTENGGMTASTKMRAVGLPLRDDSACTSYYGAGGYSPPLSVCAGGTGTASANNADTCQGDSGGPLAIRVNGVLKLAGITSRGDQCGQPGVPAVYTEASNPEICGLLGGGSECVTQSSSPPPAAPAPATRDTTRPTARLTSLRCRKRTCSFRVRTADKGGGVRSLSARVYRRVRVCRTRGGRRSCRTVMRSKRLKTKKITGGYSGKTKLNVARYRLDAVAKDAAGNRSKAARKRFRVKKR